MTIRVGLALAPVITVASIVAGIVISYSLAATRGDVTRVMSFISYAGNDPPQSHLFTFLLMAGSYSGMVTCVIRYGSLSAYFGCEHINNKHLLRANKASLVIGILSFVGFTMVANFQTGSTVPFVSVLHDIGSCLSAYGSVVCMWMQSVLSLYAARQPSSNCSNGSMKPLNGLPVVVTRFILSVIATLALVTCTVLTAVSTAWFDGSDKFHWSTLNAGYREHVAAAIAEFVLVLAVMVAMLTFVAEFRSIRLVAHPLLFDCASVGRGSLDPDVCLKGTGDECGRSQIAACPAEMLPCGDFRASGFATKIQLFQDNHNGVYAIR